MRENRTQRLLREGQTAVGAWVVGSEPTTTELLADVGFDFLVVDTEHAPQSPLSVQAHFMALEGSQATPMARVLWNDFVRVKQLLDLGAQGIVFPWVSTPEHARQAVAATRYPPQGLRGWGPRRAIRYADDALDYYRHAAESILVLCQIETREALDDLHAIAAVEGVDALMIGPADLSIALGVPFDLDAPAFADAVAQVRDAAQEAGIAFGVITSGAGPARRWMAEGARLVVAGSDDALLRMKARETLDEIREAMGDEP
ncbi:MAG: HpcH/HpaI aldolase family protein [Candidatus Brocadiia bacterium]